MPLEFFSCPRGDWVSGDAVNDPRNRPVILVSGRRGVNQRLGNIQNCKQRGLLSARAPAPSSAIGRQEAQLRGSTMKITSQAAPTGRRAAQQAARLSFAPPTPAAAASQQRAVAEFSLGGLLGGIGRGIAGLADKVIPGGGALTDALLPGNQGFTPMPTFGPSSGGNRFGPALPGRAGQCQAGCFKVGERCVCPGDLFPGGSPGITPVPGSTNGSGGCNSTQATEGAFGMPAMVPCMEQRVHRSCPRGMVLGEDDLCYPKAVLGRRSKFRKWKGATRPPISASQMRAIRQAARAKDKVRELGKDVGLKVTNR